MIKLLTKIEQDYGLPVAISLAKQTIEQNAPLVKDLKTCKNRIVETYTMSRLLAWAPTKEGHKYWSNISKTLNEEYSISYSDLEEYASKDSNNKNLLQKLEEAHGKDVTTSFVKQILMNKTSMLNRSLERKKTLHFIYDTLCNAFSWTNSVEGDAYWTTIAGAYRKDMKRYELTIEMIEDYAKHTNIKTVTIDTMQKILKEPKMAMIAPFNKGSLNIKGIIHQAAKGIKDDRPFVVALIDEELESVKTVIKNNPRDIFNYEGYDIRVHHLKNLILESKTTIEAVEDFKITPLLAIRFYEFEKLIKKPLDCSWIKSYLTQENMQKPSVSLFKSNKMSIKLENGIVSLVDFKTNRTYNTPVLYDKTKNEFYL